MSMDKEFSSQFSVHFWSAA